LFKSVHIYRSYRQNKPGGPFLGPHGISIKRMYSLYVFYFFLLYFVYNLYNKEY